MVVEYFPAISQPAPQICAPSSIGTGKILRTKSDKDIIKVYLWKVRQFVSIGVGIQVKGKYEYETNPA